MTGRIRALRPDPPRSRSRRFRRSGFFNSLPFDSERNPETMTPDELHDRLSILADPACKAFGDSLQPGVTDRLGVRMPLVRRVARDVMRTEDVRAFLNAMLAAGGFASQEALMVCVIVAGGAKGLEVAERLAFVDRLLPHMTGWATCDLTGSAVRVFRENRE